MTGPVPVRDDLGDLEPYGAPQLDVPVRLNTNETAEAPPDGYLPEVGRRIQGLPLHRYPDRRSTELRTALGALHGLGPERVWVANGSNEVLQQLLQAYGGPGRRIVTTRPGYSMYQALARVMATAFEEQVLADDFVVTLQDAEAMAALDGDLVMLANPNNPTGLPVDLDVVRHLHDRCRGLVVIDEAYVEFADAGDTPTSALGLLDDCPRLVIVRTFSKAYRLAGLRVGHLLAHDWVIDDLRKVRLPYHVDAVKQVAALVALEQSADFLGHRVRVAEERARVLEALGRRPDVETWPSAANFVLLRVDDAAATFTGLLSRGVLVRDFSSKPSLAGCLRVTIGTPADNDAFLTALAETLDEKAAS